MTNNNENNKVTGSIPAPEVDKANQITREESTDIDFILDEWEKRSKIMTNLTREELKRLIVKTGDYEYKIDMPVKNILNIVIPLTIQVSPALFDPSVPKMEGHRIDPN